MNNTPPRMLKIGDYVLATKWQDGDPGDAWCVGFYDGILPKVVGVRHLVIDENGNQFRSNGFRRVKKISHARGAFILENKLHISQGSTSLWWWARVKIPTIQAVN